MQDMPTSFLYAKYALPTLLMVDDGAWSPADGAVTGQSLGLTQKLGTDQTSSLERRKLCHEWMVTGDWTEVLVVVAGLGPSLRPALPPAPGGGLGDSSKLPPGPGRRGRSPLRLREPDSEEMKVDSS